jgi:hypothetical protein
LANKHLEIKSKSVTKQQSSFENSSHELKIKTIKRTMIQRKNDKILRNKELASQPKLPYPQIRKKFSKGYETDADHINSSIF